MNISNILQSVLLIFFLTPVFLKAQAPGYLGKRLSFDFSSEFQMALEGPTKNEKSLLGNSVLNEPNESQLAFNSTWKGEFDYAISRYNSVGLALSYAATGMTTRFLDYNNFHQLAIRKVGIRYLNFRPKKGSIAPIGGSFHFGLDAIFLKGEVLRSLLNRKNTPPLVDGEVGGLQQKFTAAGLNMGWNRRTLIVENVFIKTGFSVNFILPSKKYTSFFDTLNDHPEFTSAPGKATFESNALKRVYKHNLILFEIGLGVILL